MDGRKHRPQRARLGLRLGVATVALSAFATSAGAGDAGLLMEWAVNKNYDIYRPNTGKLLLPGSRIWWEEHLHAVGDEIRDHVELAVYLYPKGQEPKTQWIYTPVDDPAWLSVLPQDFSNMAAVQQGMKCAGFRGTLPNPYRERSIANLHWNLAKYMGTGAPRKLR